MRERSPIVPKEDGTSGKPSALTMTFACPMSLGSDEHYGQLYEALSVTLITVILNSQQ